MYRVYFSICTKSLVTLCCPLFVLRLLKLLWRWWSHLWPLIHTIANKPGTYYKYDRCTSTILLVYGVSLCRHFLLAHSTSVMPTLTSINCSSRSASSHLSSVPPGSSTSHCHSAATRLLGPRLKLLFMECSVSAYNKWLHDLINMYCCMLLLYVFHFTELYHFTLLYVKWYNSEY